MTTQLIKHHVISLSLLHTIFCVAYLNSSQPEKPNPVLLSKEATLLYNYYSSNDSTVPKYEDAYGTNSHIELCHQKMGGHWNQRTLSHAEDEIKNYYQWQLEEAIQCNSLLAPNYTLEMIVQHMYNRYLFEKEGFASMYGGTNAERKVCFEKARLSFLSTAFIKTKTSQNDSVTNLILQKIAQMQTHIIGTVISDVSISQLDRLAIASSALTLAIATDTPEVMESLVDGIIKTANELKNSSEEHKTLKEYKNLEEAEDLLQLFLIDCTPKTLLETAIKNGKTGAIEWLLKNDTTKLKNGALITSDCITINIPQSDETGNVEVNVEVDVSPLAYALHIKDESLSNFLIENGAIIGEREKEFAHKTGVKALINLVTQKSVDKDSSKDNLHGQKIEKTEGTKTQSISQTPEAQQQSIRPTITAPSLFVTQNFLKSALVVGGMVSVVALIMYTIKALQKTSQEQETFQKNDSHKETESYDPAILI